MSVSVSAVTAGREAWVRIRDRDKKSWQDWIAVARAISIGRSAALKAANTNQPVGTKYNRAMGEWLEANGLTGINTQVRYRALLVLKHLPAIEEWRATLSDAKRDKLNHPNAAWFAWKRATKPKEPPPAPVDQTDEIRQRVAVRRRTGRKVFWPQDALRRAHSAMLQSRSTDLLTLARVALQAAVTSEDDLLALLPESKETATAA